MAEEEKTQQELEAEAAAQAKAEEGKQSSETKESDKEDDIDAKLTAMYGRFNAENEQSTKTETVEHKAETSSDTSKRQINTLEDFNKWKEEDPDSANAWMMRTVAEATVRSERIKEARKADADTWMKNERAVLARHHKGIKSDGSIDHADPWMKAYIQVGKENPQLLAIPNGPLLAEAMADKMVSSDEIDKARADGAKEEADRSAAAEHANTGVSTTRRPADTKINLSEDELKMAARFRMTPEEWVKYSKEKVISKIQHAAAK